MIDDHSRLGFACVHPDEKIPSAIAALEQALSFFALHGVKVTGVMTDNGSCYTSYAFADACRMRGIKHIFTRPYRPRQLVRPNASYKPSPESGLTAVVINPATNVTPTCLIISSNITGTDLTAH